MQNEGTIACKRRVSFCSCPGLVIWRFGRGEVGNVEPRPLLLRFIPPDQFLTFAPWVAIGTRRRPVIQDAAVGRPGKCPAVSVEVSRFPLIGAIFAGSREDSGINPATGRGGPISLQIPITTDQRAIG